jgi:hypothetical protein
MLRSISLARLAAARAVSHDASATTTAASAVHRLPLRMRSVTYSNQPSLVSTIGTQTRSYATRGRPKAGKATGSTTRARRPRAATTTTGTKTPKRKTTTRASAKGKKTATTKPKKRAQTEKQKATAAKKKERDELKELKAATLSATEPKRKPDSAYRVFVTENAIKGVNAAQHMKETAAKFRELSAAELEVRPILQCSISD